MKRSKKAWYNRDKNSAEAARPLAPRQPTLKEITGYIRAKQTRAAIRARECTAEGHAQKRLIATRAYCNICKRTIYPECDHAHVAMPPQPATTLPSSPCTSKDHLRQRVLKKALNCDICGIQISPQCRHLHGIA